MQFEFDILEPTNRCGAAIVSIASITERIALSYVPHVRVGRTFESWDEILDRIRQEVASFRTQGEATSPATFLSLNNRSRTRLDGRNPTSITRFENALTCVLKRYFQQGSAFTLFLEFDEERESDQERRFLKHAITSIKERLVVGWLDALLQEVRPSDFPDKLIARTLKTLLGEVVVPRHPKFRSLEL